MKPTPKNPKTPPLRGKAGISREKAATGLRSGKKPYSAYKYLIGVDPGVNTGLAVMRNGKLEMIRTWPIHDVILWLKELAEYQYHPSAIMVRVEDARKRKWFGNAGRAQLQGAGSIKRDCGILEAFLTDLEVDFELVAPKNNKTKLSAEAFKKITGWTQRTSEHSRDAAMLVYGL